MAMISAGSPRDRRRNLLGVPSAVIRRALALARALASARPVIDRSRHGRPRVPREGPSTASSSTSSVRTIVLTTNTTAYRDPVRIPPRFDRVRHLPAFLMGQLPAKPQSHRVLTGGDWRKVGSYVTPGIVLAALAMLAAVLVVVLTLRDLPVFRTTLWSLLTGLAKSLFEGHLHASDFYPSLEGPRGEGRDSQLWAQILVTSLVIGGSSWFLRRIPEFALWEEQAFREGCECWTVRERLRSASIFGAAHFLNLIYPIATVLALVVGGWLFMVCYLHEYRRSRDRVRATYRATALHSVYNCLALAVLSGSILFFVWIGS